MLFSVTVTVKLICVFVFTYADCWFSHDAAHCFSGKGISCLIGRVRFYSQWREILINIMPTVLHQEQEMKKRKHCENLPMQYTEIFFFSDIKTEKKKCS